MNTIASASAAAMLLPHTDPAAGGKAQHAELTKEEINQLPLRAWEGDVIIVREQRQLSAALAMLQKEKVLGFDTETKPCFTKGHTALPALIQLATQNNVFLFQLKHLCLGLELAGLLSSNEHLKVGVAIHDDMKALGRLYPFEAGGIVDIAQMARSQGIKAQGLRTLAANLLGFRISKGAQCSNWENEDLTPQQIKYAATDAWVGRQLYCYLAAGLLKTPLQALAKA